MNAYANPGQNFNRTVEDIFEKVEAETRQAAAYFDRVIVPQIRHESGSALRLLASHMVRLADHIDPAGKQGL